MNRFVAEVSLPQFLKYIVLGISDSNELSRFSDHQIIGTNKVETLKVKLTYNNYRRWAYCKGLRQSVRYNDPIGRESLIRDHMGRSK